MINFPYNTARNYTVDEFIESVLTIRTENEIAQLKKEYKALDLYQEPEKISDQYGLFQDYNHLKKISTRLCFIPIQLAADYADQICKNSLHEYSLKDIPAFDVDKYHFMNATSVGNIAYIYCNTKDKFVKDRCGVFITKLIKHELEMFGFDKHFKQEPKVIKPIFHA